MSEFQLYAFHALDKPLDAAAKKAVGEMSSRVRLSPRMALFTYSYSDFRYNEEDVLLQYFDFMFHQSSWGRTRVLMKFPEEAVDYALLKKYRISVLNEHTSDIRIVKKEGFILVDIDYTEEEGPGWIEEDDAGYELLSMRQEIMLGDYRALFIIWLRFLEDRYAQEAYEYENDDDDEYEAGYPIETRLIPPNLASLPPSARAAKQLFKISPDWLNALRSYSSQPSQPTIDYEERLLQLPPAKMLHYLQMLLREEPQVRMKLLQELKGETATVPQPSEVLFLSDIGEQIEVVRQAEAEKARQVARERKIKKLEQMQSRQAAIEKEIRHTVAHGARKYYEEAIATLVAFREMHEHFGTQAQFEKFVAELAQEFSRKSSFMALLKQKGMV